VPRFATTGACVPRPSFSPGITSSAGNGSTRPGNRYLARVLGEAAVVAGKTDTFLGEPYRRVARRQGKKQAIVAVGRSLLVIIWHLLQNPDARFHDLPADRLSHRTNPDTSKRNHVRELKPSATPLSSPHPGSLSSNLHDPPAAPSPGYHYPRHPQAPHLIFGLEQCRLVFAKVRRQAGEDGWAGRCWRYSPGRG
jgi:hypothetical protein